MPKSSNLTNETSDVDIKHNPNSERGDVVSNIGGKSERSSISKIDKRKNREKPLSEILGKEELKKLAKEKDPQNMFEDEEDKNEAMKLLAETFKHGGSKKEAGNDWLSFGMKPRDFEASTLNPRLI
jgi:hypothetical protein